MCSTRCTTTQSLMTYFFLFPTLYLTSFLGVLIVIPNVKCLKQNPHLLPQVSVSGNGTVTGLTLRILKFSLVLLLLITTSIPLSSSAFKPILNLNFCSTFHGGFCNNLTDFLSPFLPSNPATPLSTVTRILF